MEAAEKFELLAGCYPQITRNPKLIDSPAHRSVAVIGVVEIGLHFGSANFAHQMLIVRECR